MNDKFIVGCVVVKGEWRWAKAWWVKEGWEQGLVLNLYSKLPSSSVLCVNGFVKWLLLQRPTLHCKKQCLMINTRFPKRRLNPKHLQYYKHMYNVSKRHQNLNTYFIPYTPVSKTPKRFIPKCLGVQGLHTYNLAITHGLGSSQTRGFIHYTKFKLVGPLHSSN